MSIQFSIIVPTFNRPFLVRECLDAISPDNQNMKPERYEVIVSDDNFQPTILTDFSWATWVEGPQKGPAANRNNGAKFAKGEWLIFLDDDCLPDRDLLNKYSEAIISNPSTKVFEGKIYVNEPKYSLGITSPVNLSGGYLWSCNFLIERKLFISLNGFDERFPYAAMEDVDLRIRILKGGNKIKFIPEAAVCHPWRKKGGWKKVMQHNKSTLLFLEKHPEERVRINSLYYLKLVSRGLLFDTMPGLVKYKGRGFWAAVVEHFGYLKMAAHLLIFKIKL